MSYQVEFKANVQPASIEDALTELELTDDDAERRSIYFLDTAEGARPLSEHDVIVRLRRGKESDFTLKLRPCHVGQLPDAWRDAQEHPDWEYKIEWDWTGTNHQKAASLTRSVDRGLVDNAIHDRDLATLFSPEQLDLFAGYTGTAVGNSPLRSIGPVVARKWKTKIDGHKVHCEEWLVGDQLRFLELSGHAHDPEQARTTQHQLERAYQHHQLQVSTDPELKTQAVMDFFATNPH